ncbi:FtsX-like permease family protein [Actinospica robiniae]|uniref:FtsX-like permease family protein n=1 Tax=Actinospica robiniae TaxID=304901 RepID=UPI00040D47BB|nr:FtsX-like permease family protein [Actinospica robiniae]
MTALRELRTRHWALAALAAAVAVAAGLAALFATAWGTGLSEGAQRDLRASSADAVVISRPAQDFADNAASAQRVRDAVAHAGSALWHVDALTVSEIFDLPSESNDASTEQTYAVSSAAVRPHAILTAGTWPIFVPGKAIGVAVPESALEAMDLRVGASVSLTDPNSHSSVAFVVTGSFRYADDDPGALTWNQIGMSGVEPSGPTTYFGPLVANPAAFAAGALSTASGTWVLTPATGDQDSATLAAQASALLHSADLAPQNGFTVSSGLPGLVAGIAARTAAGRAQLLAGAILLGVLAGVALAAAAGSLVARSRVQAALLCSRGAPRRTLVSFYVVDVAIVFLFAVGGVLTQSELWGEDFGRAIPSVAWVSGLAVALVASLLLCGRAARTAEPADVAIASGRQSSVPGIIRAGGDIALIALAGVAVWQAGEVGLSTRAANGSGATPVLIVAAAPALAVAAGAALCGRLVGGGARVAEFVARRVRSAPVRLATWELARTPLRYFVPALLCVASVAGCGSLAAQHASRLRSAHDQAAFVNGAQVAVALRQTLPPGEVASVASAPGVIAATPVDEIDIGTGTLVALDAANAASTVALRADLVDGSAAKLWAGLTPSSSQHPVMSGISVPGRPVALGLTGTLTATGHASNIRGDTVSVALTIQDAVGLTYSIPVGQLAPDEAEHALSAQIAPDAKADYPLRIIGVTLGTADKAYKLAISGLTEQVAGGGGTISFPGAAAMAKWTRHNQSTDVMLAPAAGPGLVVPALATDDYLSANGVHIGSTVQLSVNGVSVSALIIATVSAFPALPAGNPDGLIVDLPTLADVVNAGGAELWPSYTWWLDTKSGNAPAALPAGAVATTADEVQANLISDPLSAIPQQALDIATPALVLLAMLGLVTALLAASRDSARRDAVLGALGTTRSQLVGLTCLLHACVIVPAALLGTGLGFLFARVFTPVFVLGADGSPPRPSVMVLLDATWSATAALIIVATTVTVALASCLARTGRFAQFGARG